LRVIPRRRLHQFVLWEHVYNVLAKYVSGILLSSTSEYSMSIVAGADANIDGIIRDIGDMGDVERIEEQAILCMVGTNLRKCDGLMTKTAGALAGCGITGVSFGPSSSSLVMVLDDPDVMEAVKIMHAELFGSVGQNHVFEALTAPALP